MKYNIFEHFSNVEFISNNDLPVDVANKHGEFLSIPLSLAIVEPCLSTAKFNKNVINIFNHKNIVTCNSNSKKY